MSQKGRLVRVNMNALSELLTALNANGLQDMHILIVDDEEAHRLVLRTTLASAEFRRITCLDDPRLVIDSVNDLEPDLLLLDLNMPHKDGFAVLEELQVFVPHSSYLPVLVLTSDERSSTKQRALANGAHDYLKKPFDNSEVILRVRNLLRTRLLTKQLEQSKTKLEELVAHRTEQLERSQLEMLTRLAKAAEYRDDEAGEHIWRVAHLSAQLAQELGQDTRYITLMLRAARLHDVGKVAIPDVVLMKPGKLTPKEFELIQSHTRIGAQLLSGGHSPLIKMAETIALTHHERWDGNGYPRKLKGEAIPLEGRILAVADAFDALTHDRYYRRALSLEEAVREIRAQSGKHFDPNVVQAFLKLYERGDLTDSRPMANPSLTHW